jgi:hypothetical protein
MFSLAQPDLYLDGCIVENKARSGDMIVVESNGASSRF